MIFEKYEKIDKEERDKFKEYIFNYYGQYGMFDFFKGKLTRRVIAKYVSKFIDTRKKLGLWGGGDSLDRETFRDVLLVKLDLDYNTPGRTSAYNIQPYLDAYLTKVEKDVKKYNL